MKRIILGLLLVVAIFISACEPAQTVGSPPLTNAPTAEKDTSDYDIDEQDLYRIKWVNKTTGATGYSVRAYPLYMVEVWIVCFNEKDTFRVYTVVPDKEILKEAQ